MKRLFRNSFKSIAMVSSMAMLFLCCTDNYERVGEEAKKTIYPQGVAQNFKLTYTEMPEKLESEAIDSSKVVAVLTSPISEDFENLRFKHQTFPEGLQIDFYNEKGEKTVIKADYGISYSITNLIDLRGNVVIDSHDGKKLEAPQIYWDRSNEWIFTQEKFKYTNPEDGTVMDGEGMDFNRDFTFFNAHKTYGLMMIKEELE
ncbi:LPS export ABC transporter periplasmic protein LptC [Costertonia aggregata]|uniref:LPS export ABC transporter periplasmic protein LptC n=1 Tax=Costertonia aggregata TaxID=343403 RepID=A0A7H9AQM2_9FLAO|nr:LPS export ABC transporter periplasmic protein LptC [Costertonia aggregata]QLG45791.1 LPS export ABC transporter periplasmic protein LptC [Costertonia aggregata]